LKINPLCDRIVLIIEGERPVACPFFFSPFLKSNGGFMGFLSDEFLYEYAKTEPNWGFKSGPNSIGEITYRRTYSRDGEQWWETVQRVVEGVYEILENHCTHYNIPFDEHLAIHDAQEMYDLIFNFKFLPPGRGLWMMGTDYVRQRGTMALNNCAFVSTENIDKDLSKPFEFLMDASMLGVGVGFDTRGAGKIAWNPSSQAEEFVVEDSREGWVASMAAALEWGFGLRPQPVYDYSKVRKAGEPINGFGGVSEGPLPLIKLNHQLKEIIVANQGEKISSRNIVDIFNLIGCCVVSGNVRRSAEIAFGEVDDQEFLDLKNYEKNPERVEYGWASNNSLFAEVGMDYSRFADAITRNGEPGFIWLENIQKYGRMAETPNNKDWRVRGTNPCVEQSLEPYEVCCLVETFPHHHESIEEYQKTLKYAFIYAKAVTLGRTHWKETNAVMLRNRRIGTSMSGIAQFIANRGKKELISWCSDGYRTIQKYDRIYSEWLCIRESIKTTSIKPSGTVSLLAGATPGCHYPTFRYYIRRIRFPERHPDIERFIAAGYRVEPAINEPNTVIVEFPVQGDEKVSTEREVSVGEKLSVAVLLQRYWADNQVSCTATFDPEREGHLIPDLLAAYDTQLKGVSFLPMNDDGGSYVQMPYEAITKEVYEDRIANLQRIEWGESLHEETDSFCDGLACTIK
jgi:ribonucleoside-triphosphate reductase (thioredoxin)